MPAIHPARLKQQAALLATYFDQPAAFVRSLHHLLDAYADRAHRPGRAGAPPPLIPAYHVRPPVLRQILQELAPLAESDPETALALCDALWEQPFMEFRQLAASLLGRIPLSPFESIFIRVQTWLEPRLEGRLATALVSNGFARLRQEDPDELLRRIENWLEDESVFWKQIGLRSLLFLVSEPGFENVPILFRLIQPLARSAPAALRPDLLDVLIALAHRSSKETAYFLRQTLEVPVSPDTPWLIRQVAREFPPELQESLRNAVRGGERFTR